MKFSSFFTTLLFTIISASANAADIDAGKSKAVSCAGCHGPAGIAMVPNFPNLAGQKKTYLAQAIKAYKNGERNDPTMKAMVIALSDEDIENLAAYFSSLQGK